MTGAVVAVAVTGSTNADLLADAGWPEGRWLRADRQTAGRGRLGRSWSSPIGNLYASTVVRLSPDDPPATGLALMTGVALSDALAVFVPVDAPLTLKWPNDLLSDGAKLAGVLLERTGDRVVVGVGANLTHAPTLPDRATAKLADIAPPPSAGALVIVLAERFAAWLAQWRRDGFDVVRQAWLARAHPVGTPIEVTDSCTRGLFDGLGADGSLRLRRPDGTVATVRTGDIRMAR